MFFLWIFTQLITTVAFISFYPFIVCLLFQIQHIMASNPWNFQIRKIIVVTCLISQIVISTFLRDQHVWNEDVNEQKELPTSLLCGLSRYTTIKKIHFILYRNIQIQTK